MPGPDNFLSQFPVVPQAAAQPGMAAPGAPGAPGAAPAADPGLALGGGGEGDLLNSDKHGDEFLSTLPKGMALTVKAIAEGRSPYPAGFLQKTPFGQRLTTFTQQYDPEFDAGSYPARAAQRKNYLGGGKQYQELQSINTVAGHLQNLMSSADGLNNYEGLGPLNAPVNYARATYRGWEQDPALAKFNTDKQAVLTELGKAYRGGQVTESELRQWQSNLDTMSTPSQVRTVIGELNDLLASKRLALEEGYRGTMGQYNALPKDFSSVNDRTRKIFDNVGAWSRGAKVSTVNSGLSDQGGSPAPAAPAAPSPALAPGQSTVLNGITIKRVN